MSLLNKTVSFLAVLACMPAAFAVTARPAVNVINAASSRSRMPTMSTTVTTGTVTTTTGTTTSTLLANSECIEAYKSCIESADACGPNMEECTTKVLFHGKMPQCLGTLAQCQASGVTSLFGTSTITALSTVAQKNSYGEVTDYTYPTDGSVLGQMITAAAISNRYDTSSCVKRYTSCLKKDSVCGNDFELCTTNSEFKKQMVFCDSTLARCQSEGKIELFGTTTAVSNPTASSRIGEMIAEGAALAAINAVSTCYKVVDQCILNACATNPYKCFENASAQTVQLVENINSGQDVTTADALADAVTNSAIAGYVRNACMDTIGANKYCYATFLGEGQMPTASQLSDEDNQEEVYDEAYRARMNVSMKSKIADLVDKFDQKAKSRCAETIKSCAMRVCGSGNGAACYSQVFGAVDKSINNSISYAEIKTGCSDIVNTDTYCKYAAANPNASGTYSYSYINTSAFDTLFPEYDSSENDPIGVIASLNASLANAYNDATLAQKKKQCQAVATSCVKSMCGTDYVNCYRNRTDIYSSLTNTGDSTFDDSMNKVGGVLDYTVVLGLCLDTVKNADVCEEHLAIETNKLKVNSSKGSVWGGATNVRDGWIDAGAATSVTAELDERVAVTDENGNPMCRATNGEQGICNTVSASGLIYSEPITMDTYTYHQTQAANSLFKDLIYDLDKEVQAIYNAKLTKEQNMCMQSNMGGIIGNKDIGSTYMWAKLRSKKVPNDYSINGLAANQFIASNDLYGSFCRVRVTIQSDDKNIQNLIADGAKWANAYFAVGDAFTCGSWIPNDELEEIANAVAAEKTAAQKEAQKKTLGWVTALGSIATATGGAFLADSIYEGKAFGGRTGLSENRATKKFRDAKQCVEWIDNVSSQTTADGVKSRLQKAIDYANSAGVDTSEISGAMLTGITEKPTTVTQNSSGQKITTGGGVEYSETMQKAITDLRKACSDAQSKKDGEDKDGKPAKDMSALWSSVGAVVTGVGGGIAVYHATKDIQEANMTAAEKAAYDEWMNSVGKHIHCYIGGDEAGDYGDVITTSIE